MEVPPPPGPAVLGALPVLYGLAAQNSHSVTHVEYASVEMIRATIEALEEDLPAAAVKLGMMGTNAVVSVVAEFLDGYDGKVVCDPVMISTRCEASHCRPHWTRNSCSPNLPSYATIRSMCLA